MLEAKLDLNIGVAWHGEQQYEKAAEAYEQAARRVRQALGPDHAQARLYAADRDLNLGLAARKREQIDEVRRHLGAAAASGQGPVVAKALVAWAQAEIEANDAPAAAARVAALVELLDEGSDLSPITLATAKTTAGQILDYLEDPRGIPMLEDACVQWSELAKTDERVRCEVALGRALRDAGRMDEARRVAARVRGLARALPQGASRTAVDALLRSLEADPAAPSP